MQDRSGSPASFAARSALEGLLDPHLDGAAVRFPPEAIHPDWAIHLPFLGWMLAVLRPRTVLCVGTATAPAFLAACEAAARLALPTQCRLLFHPDRPPQASILHRQETSFQAFSRVAALPDHGVDGSADLLIADSVELPAEWRGRLSPAGVLVLHGDPDASAHVAPGCRRFALQQTPDLALFAAGTETPGALAPLLALPPDSPVLLRLRDRLVLLGERWKAESRARETEQTRAAEQDSERTERERLSDALRALSTAHDRLRDELAHAKADRFRLQQAADRAEARLLHQDAAHRNAQLEARREAEAGNAASAAAIVSRLDTLHRAATIETERQRAEHEAMRQAERDAARAVLAAARADADALREQASDTERRIRALEDSLSWRVTGPLRSLRAKLRIAPPAFAEPAPGAPALPEPAFAEPSPIETAPIETAHAEIPTLLAPEPVAPSPPPAIVAPEPDALVRPRITDGGWRKIRRILFVAGEPGTPGASYRTERNAAACRAAGYEADCVDIAGVNPDNLAAADLLVLWRAGHSGHVQTMLELAAAARTRVAFDIDDLIFQPSLAVAEIIDGIRTTFVTEAESRSYFQSMQRTLTSSDLCIATTRELALAAGAMHPMVQVIPNIFDATVERASRRAVRLRGECSADGLVRLGYAGGTRTHQRDFAAIVPSLAIVLRDRPQSRLVLFRDGRSREGLVLIDEFPELLPFADRIEWRDMVPLADLPAELARFDISLCPLELGNPFCEAKSELKYFESALADVCLVASPTAPFRRAVRDGVTGFLPADGDSWTETLLALVDDPALRRRVARDAYHDVLWRFGFRRQVEQWSLLLRQLDGGVEGARAADLALRRGDHAPAGLPEVPDGEILFSHDGLGEAEVTVGITSFNYARHLPDALRSVLEQTLAHLDLVVVDDGSADGSVPLLLDWAERNRTRFNRLRILRTARNSGLGAARNLMFTHAETPWIMVLDADNRLAPDACETLLRAVEADRHAAFAYPRIRQFEGADILLGDEDFQPARLAAGNYIDAMALVAKWAWAAAGGYYTRRDSMGWEDFSLWCRMVELGLHGLPVAEELAFYRTHEGSMTNFVTEQTDHKRNVVGFVEERHPWLRLRMRAARKRLVRPNAPTG